MCIRDRFDSALMKTSVISKDFQERFLSSPGAENVFEARAVVFEGPEDYHDRINDPSLEIGEETMLFDALATIRANLPDTLLVVVPRHADRGADIAREAEAAGLAVARRSEGHPVESETAVYVADTMGELGLFYSLSDAAFIGGSLVPHGGQNPLEAVRLGTAVLSGPHHANFADTFRDLNRREAAIIVHDAEGLASAALNVLLDADMREALTLRAQSAIAEMAGALDATTQALLELLPEPDIEVETADPQEAAARTTRKLSRAS
mgnify:CR=1 FL=1